MNYFYLKSKLEKEKNIEFEDFIRQYELRDIGLIEIICERELSEIKALHNTTMLNANKAASIMKTSYQTLDRRRKAYNSIEFYQAQKNKEISYNIKHIAMYLYTIYNTNCVFSKLFSNYFEKIEQKRFENDNKKLSNKNVKK